MGANRANAWHQHPNSPARSQYHLNAASNTVTSQLPRQFGLVSMNLSNLLLLFALVSCDTYTNNAISYSNPQQDAQLNRCQRCGRSYQQIPHGCRGRRDFAEQHLACVISG